MLTENPSNQRKPTSGPPDYPAELKPEEVVLKITTYEATQNPDYRLIHNGYIKEGPRAYKVAIMYEVVNRHTKEFHHFVLDIVSLQRLKRGWYFTYESKFTLNGEKGEVDALYKFLSLFYNGGAPTEAGTFYTVTDEEVAKMKPLVEDNVEDLVQAVLENPDSYKELVKAGGKELLQLLAEAAKKQGESINLIADFIGSLNDLEGEDKIQILTAIKNQNLSEKDLNIISGRIDGLEIFSRKLFDEKDWNEKDWQAFLENNTWILGYGLDYKFLKILQREATVSGVTAAGREAVNVDFLVGDENFTVLVELKRPDTPLFKKNQNRSGSWKLSDDLIDATTQILEQKAEWQIKGKTIQYDIEGKPISQLTVDPKSILIIGDTSEFHGDTLENKIKAETFEMYRRNLRNIEIYTFDEIFNRAEFIISHE
jgi:hypothetical protein